MQGIQGNAPWGAHPEARTEGLVPAPPHAVPCLEDALRRYLAMQGIERGTVPLGRTLRDRTEHYRFYTPPREGIPDRDEACQVGFMAAVTSMPRAWCAWWTYLNALEDIGHDCPRRLDAVEDAYEVALALSAEA